MRFLAQVIGSHGGHGTGRVQNKSLNFGTAASNNTTSENRFGAGNRGWYFPFSCVLFLWQVAPIQVSEAH